MKNINVTPSVEITNNFIRVDFYPMELQDAMFCVLNNLSFAARFMKITSQLNKPSIEENSRDFQFHCSKEVHSARTIQWIPSCAFIRLDML